MTSAFCASEVRFASGSYEYAFCQVLKGSHHELPVGFAPTQPPPPRMAGAGSGVEESEVELTPLRGTIESWRQGLLARQESPRKTAALADDGADEAEVDRRARTAQSRLRWGVVEMPDGWREPLDTDDGGHVGHLSFGVAGCDVQPPVEGNLYA